MRIYRLHGAPPPELAEALTAFETQFTYPLGPGRSFRICHGDDYPRFFRAMGEAACFVVEQQGCVLGTLGAALRGLTLPDGSERSVLYLGDLKIVPSARGGKTLLRLVRAAQKWAGTRTNAAFGVVMDGTAVTPERYTGRFDIPAFRELGKVGVLRLSTLAERGSPDERFLATDTSVEAAYRRLSLGRYASLGGNPAERSEMAPLWLMHPEGASCGRLEDTRRAKRLFTDDDTEMHAVHLSAFAFQDQRAGVELLREALRRAAALAFPALFVAVASDEAKAIQAALKEVDIVAASATVYGFGLEPFPLWHLNTAEISIMSENSRAPRVTARAGEILHKSNILHNPYLEALRDGSMALDCFRRTQEQFFFAVTFFPRPMAALVGRIADPRLRLDILHNLVEEHGEFQEQQFHHTTFQQFLRSIGGNPEQLQSTPLWPAVRAFNSVLTASCVLDELEVGVACMGTIEYAFAGISAAIGSAVVRNGWVTSENLVHYKLHAEIDERHAEEFFAVIEPHEDDPRRRHFIDQGLKLGAYIFDRLYRDLYTAGREEGAA